MKIRKIRSLSLVLVVTGLGVSVAGAVVPAGWNIAGSAPAEYEFSQATISSSGKYGALIQSRAGSASGFGTLMQTISAEEYRGSRWRLSGYMKTEDAARAQMWMRVDGPEKAILAFDNMDSRSVSGTTDWKRYEIVLDVPEASVDIAFGFFLAGGGKAWADNFKLEKVDATVPTTSRTPGKPRAPANPDFER